MSRVSWKVGEWERGVGRNGGQGVLSRLDIAPDFPHLGFLSQDFLSREDLYGDFIAFAISSVDLS